MANIRTVRIPQGEVRGLYDTVNSVSHFLGIPYGVVSQRWTRASAILDFATGIHDGTHYGPICPQVHQQEAPSIQQLAVPGFPPNPAPKMDEFACLNLNITKPEASLEPMPVMVFIHGGGYTLGSNTEIVYDGMGLVQASIDADNPIIHVAINYRLGYFGFVASEELKNEVGGMSVGNYGLWDQRMALDFIKQNISKFGGDPNFITIFGESAGGASVHAHLLAEAELFSQAICQSGVVHTVGPLKLRDPYTTERYNSLFSLLDTDTTKDLYALRSLPAESIVNLTSKQSGGALAAFFITDDTDCQYGFFPPDTDWVTIRPFCKRFMIGDCATEAVVLAPLIAQMPLADIRKLLLGSSKLLSAYLAQFGLSKSQLATFDHHTPAGMKALIDLMTDVGFHGPTQAVIAGSHPDSTFVYRFDRPNSWPASPFAGTAHHTIELLYLASVPLTFPTSEAEIDRKLSKLLMKQWVDFAVGKQPWRPYGDEHWEMIYDVTGNAVSIRKEALQSSGRRMVRGGFGEHTDEISRIKVAFSSGAVW